MDIHRFRLTDVCTLICACANVFTNIYTKIFIYIYIYTHTHTHIYIYILGERDGESEIYSHTYLSMLII